MSVGVNLPKDVEVIWKLQLPAIGPQHAYLSVPDLQTFNRLQLALSERGLPTARLLPQYRRLEGDKVVALGACVCHRDPSSHPAMVLLEDFLPSSFQTRLGECIAEFSLPVHFLSTSTLADYFHVPRDYKLMYADLYHWDPWQHQWRLQEINDILLRYGLPARKQLECGLGQRILCILGVWKDTVREEMWNRKYTMVRYAVAEPDGIRAFTMDVRYEQSQDLLVCLASHGKVAVTVEVDDMHEAEIWNFLEERVHRKPTNVVLREAVVPGLPNAAVSVSSLGARKSGFKPQVFKLMRVQATPEELHTLRPDWPENLTWKSWDEVMSALDQGFLDPDAELMVTRLLRRYPRPEELVGAT